MASDKIKLSTKAQNDLEDIWLYGFESFGLAQADAYAKELDAFFELLKTNKGLFPIYKEFGADIRIAPFNQHLVIYQEYDSTLNIIRVLHRRRNLHAHL